MSLKFYLFKIFHSEIVNLQTCEIQNLDVSTSNVLFIITAYYNTDVQIKFPGEKN